MLQRKPDVPWTVNSPSMRRSPLHLYKISEEKKEVSQEDLENDWIVTKIISNLGSIK